MKSFTHVPVVVGKHYQHSIAHWPVYPPRTVRPFLGRNELVVIYLLVVSTYRATTTFEINEIDGKAARRELQRPFRPRPNQRQRTERAPW